MKIVRTQEHEPIDLALWRAGRRGRGELEAALDATRRLAARPILPPAGVAIALPDAPRATPAKTVKLWD